ncbi:hypothetical protein JCM3775_002392 [Rhodotorula graminis]
MARDATRSNQNTTNGGHTSTHAKQGAPAAPAAPGEVAHPAQHRVRLADKDVGILSLPARDLPSYYDPPSSPSAASGSDGEGAVDGLASAIPTTNRGHKLSRLAPHTRRGRLGHHANVDAGFIDDTTSTSLVPPAQKRRKLNDLAAASSTSGFAVAPNLHLVPRSVHTLSREPDAPSPAHLPPVPQSPLDLLLTPAVQHTLGRKNNTFHLLAASATSLIEQEAELVGALTQVCRGLRGEGFDWRWDGDDERRRERDETRRKVEDEERKVGDDKEQGALDEAAATAAAASAGQPAQNGEAPAPAPTAGAVDGMDVEASPAPTATTSAPALEDEVKLEQATPVLSAPSAPGAVADPVPVPGLSPALPATSTAVEGAEQTALAQAAPTQDVEMKEAAEPTTAEGAAADNSTAAPALAADAPATAAVDGDAAPAANGEAPTASTSAPSEVPAIAVTAAGAEDPAATAADAGAAPASASTPALNGTSEGEHGAPGAGATVEPVAPSADAATAADPPTPATPATPALAATAAADSGDVASAEVTPAPSLSEEPSIRRRSGRVARGAAGAGGVSGRHTRSRQSSPEEGYTDAEDEAEGAGEGSSLDEPLAAGAAAASRPPRGQQAVEEEELPEYAARLVDPEVFVRGLFVSEGDVEMERVVPGPGGGMVGTGQMETLTPNEQEVLLHDCLTDLHRFLADTLEYRSRLLEIRDGTLGVERRRKGMHKAVRTVAWDWLQEEGAGMGVGEGYE